MNILFISHGGASIGLGHVMRCLSLAKAFRRKRHDIIFHSKLDEGKKKIRNSEFEVLENNSEDMTFDELSKLDIDLIIVDTYDVNNNYFRELKKHSERVMYIDDIKAFNYDVDIILNGNITGKYMDYRKTREKQEFLLGPKYNLIRDEFRILEKRILSKSVEKIMITTGGSDPYNLTKRLLCLLEEMSIFEHIQFSVVIGNSFDEKNIESLVVEYRDHKNVKFYKNVEKISELMLDSDIAISSCGSTLYELCACGTPTIGFIVADNQEFIAKKMDEDGYIDLLGWYDKIDLEKLKSTLEKFMGDYDYRVVMSRRQQLLVDGLGADRVVERVEEIFEKEE